MLSLRSVEFSALAAGVVAILTGTAPSLSVDAHASAPVMDASPPQVRPCAPGSSPCAAPTLDVPHLIVPACCGSQFQVAQVGTDPQSDGSITSRIGGAFDDGAKLARTGPPQHPDALNRYHVRPPWHVAGIDYAVGPWATPAKDPASIAIAGVSVDEEHRFVRVSGRGITLDGYDFSLHGGYYLIVEGNDCTITNSNFVMGSNQSYYLIQDFGNGTIIRNNAFDGTSTSTNQSGLIAVYGINPVIEYNWFYNFNQHVVEMNQLSGTSTLVYKYNLIENGGTAVAGAHVNYLQLSGGTIVNPIVEFNTSIQTPQLSSGEGYQFYGNFGATISNAICSYNTMISRGAPTATSLPVAMSVLIHPLGGVQYGDRSTGALYNNYMDMSSTYNAIYPVRSPTAFSFSSNYDMNTGGLIPIPGASQAPSPGAPVIRSAAASGATVSLAGRADANASIQVFDAAYNLVGTTIANATGAWTLTTSALTPGAHMLTATAANATGISAPSSARIVTISVSTTPPATAVPDHPAAARPAPARRAP